MKNKKKSDQHEWEEEFKPSAPISTGTIPRYRNIHPLLEAEDKCCDNINECVYMLKMQYMELCRKCN
ncbi:Protein of unknown function [Gryllus bimaculatus]|nr:Protein of unknown function [Gryllus bimaculatus]